MKNFRLDLAFLSAFVLAWALDIGGRHDPVIGLSVALVGFVVVAVLALAIQA